MAVNTINEVCDDIAHLPHITVYGSLQRFAHDRLRVVVICELDVNKETVKTMSLISVVSCKYCQVTSWVRKTSARCSSGHARKIQFPSVIRSTSATTRDEIPVHMTSKNVPKKR